MKPKNQKERLSRRIANFYKSKMDIPRFQGMYTKPGSNKK